MAIPEIVYCGNGNFRYARIAKYFKFKVGAQLPGTLYKAHKPLYFADQDYKNPRYLAYIKAIKKHQPYMASVLDMQEWRRLDEYLMRAEEISQYCQVVMLIPKVNGIISELEKIYPDRKIKGKGIRLGYSVPTRFGGTEVPIKEFGDWPVHLLGGAPHKQMELYKLFNTISVDGNYAQKIANIHCQFWVNGTATYAVNRYWPTLFEFYGKRINRNAPYKAFILSCINIMQAWKELE